MAGCLDDCRVPDWEWLQNVREKRNAISSIIAGAMFAVGWWFAIDAASAYTSDAALPKAVHTCGAVATVALIMVNAISNSQVRGDTYDSGCLGYIGARIWLFVGFLLGFAALIGACWVLFGMYVVPGKADVYPGVAIFLQNACIFFSALIFKFGRSESQWE